MSQFEANEVRDSLEAARATSELSSFWQEPSSENERPKPLTNEAISNLPATRQEVGQVALPEGLEALAAVQDFVPVQRAKTEEGKEVLVRRAVAVIGPARIEATVYTQGNFAAFDTPIEAEFPAVNEVVSFDGFALSVAIRKKWEQNSESPSDWTQDTLTIPSKWSTSIFSTISVDSAAMNCLLRRQKHRRVIGVIDDQKHPALEIDMSYAARLDEEITRREATRTGMRPVGSPEDTQKRLG